MRHNYLSHLSSFDHIVDVKCRSTPSLYLSRKMYTMIMMMRLWICVYMCACVYGIFSFLLRERGREGTRTSIFIFYIFSYKSARVVIFHSNYWTKVSILLIGKKRNTNHSFSLALLRSCARTHTHLLCVYLIHSYSLDTLLQYTLRSHSLRAFSFVGLVACALDCSSYMSHPTSLISQVTCLANI